MLAESSTGGPEGSRHLKSKCGPGYVPLQDLGETLSLPLVTSIWLGIPCFVAASLLALPPSVHGFRLSLGLSSVFSLQGHPVIGL